MGLMERLKSLIGEFEDEAGEGDAGMEDVAEDAAGAVADAACGEEEPESKPEPKAKPKHAAKPKQKAGAKAAKAESEADHVERACGQEQGEEDDEGAAISELTDKVASIEEALLKVTGGTTGLEPAGAATTDEADIRRWRELAGLED